MSPRQLPYTDNAYIVGNTVVGINSTLSHLLLFLPQIEVYP